MIEQNVACYLWTYDLFPLEDQPIVSVEVAQALTRHVWFFYRPGEPVPAVKVVENDRHAFGTRQFLRLPKWAMCQHVILHEIAHSLGFTDAGVAVGFQGHGPLYMKTIIELYAMFAGQNRQHMMERAAHFKLLVDSD